MGMHEARGTLAKSFKELTNRWRNTRAQWDDAQAEHFEQTYLLNLESDLKAAAVGDGADLGGAQSGETRL
jgi:hypothetical protein